MQVVFENEESTKTQKLLNDTLTKSINAKEDKGDNSGAITEAATATLINDTEDSS